MKIPLWHPILAIGLLGAVLVGCGDSSPPSLEVVDPWARAMMVREGAQGEGSGGNSAIYLTLRNQGGTADTLLGGKSAVVRGVEIHESFLDGDVMRMREVGPLEVPAGESVVLRPGGLHIMLLGLLESLVAGDTLSLTLDFQRTGPLRVRVPIRSHGPGEM